MRYFIYLIAIALLAGCKSNTSTDLTTGGIPQLQLDIRFLASDELEGRDTGTPGEAKAAQYIVDRFEKLGLAPGGVDGTYFQPFEFKGSPVLHPGNFLNYDGGSLIDSLFYPLNFSGSASFNDLELIDLGFGILDNDLGRNDYANKSISGHPVMIDVSSPDGIHQHSAFLAHHDLKKRAELALSKGASAVLFYRADDETQAPSKTLTENVDVLDSPVLFLNFVPESGTSVSLSFAIDRPRLQGKNVLAYLDKQQEKTIVIGAHYDHLGHGISGSLYRGEKAVHNGADDNASGVAAMLQIALDLKAKDLNHNVLFIGFSGEERGLLGSNHFVKNPTLPLEKVAYMLNMDMVGRLDTSKHRMSVNGVGTSPAWDFIDSTFTVNGLRAVTTEAGTGPSDHMSFYLAEVPVLHFFSGTHEDYHKPTDDEELINYPGIMKIVAMMEHIINEVDDDGEIAYTETQSEQKEAAAFKVTLGVVPDYLYEDKGMRVDGVSSGRPGARAGLKKGDIIIRMGEREVGDIYAYMEGLADHNPGESTTIGIVRDGEEQELNVTFD